MAFNAYTRLLMLQHFLFVSPLCYEQHLQRRAAAIWFVYGAKSASAGALAHLVSRRAGSVPVMPISIRYRWRFYDEARGRYFTTRYWCEEAFIRIQHPDAVQVPGSEQRLVVPDDIRTNSTGRFGQRPP